MATHDSLTSISDDDYLKEGYFNDNYKRVKKYIFNSDTQESTTENSFTAVKSGTLTPDSSDNVVLACKVELDLAKYSTGVAEARVRIGDWNTGTNGAKNVLRQVNSDDNFDTYTETFICSNVDVDSSQVLAPRNVPMLESSYPVYVDLMSSDSNPARIRNVTITVIVLQGPMPSSSPSFS